MTVRWNRLDLEDENENVKRYCCYYKEVSDVVSEQFRVKDDGVRMSSVRLMGLVGN